MKLLHVTRRLCRSRPVRRSVGKAESERFATWSRPIDRRPLTDDRLTRLVAVRGRPSAVHGLSSMARRPWSDCDLADIATASATYPSSWP